MLRRHPLLTILIVLLSGHVFAQETEIKGLVRDSITGAPLAYVSVGVEGTQNGTVTNDRGAFSIRVASRNRYLSVRFLGYETKTIELKPEMKQRELTILLSPTVFELENIIVRPRRERYSKKDNPAVELARKIIEHKNDNRVESSNAYKAEVYDRLTLSFTKEDRDMERDILIRRLPFLKEYIDVSPLTGKPVIAVSIRETLYDQYYRPTPPEEKIILKAKRQQGIDGTLDDSGILSSNLDEILKGISIFDNDIDLLLNRFVSPLSSTLAISYYKYYLLDTLDYNGDRCVRLGFAPFNSESYSFAGILHVLLDGSHAVKRAELNIPRNINLNWVQRLRIEQDFQRQPGGQWMLQQEDIHADFAALPGAAPELYAHRLRSYTRYTPNPKDLNSIFRIAGQIHALPEANKQTDDFWINNRHIPLGKKEASIDEMIARLRTVPAYNALIKTLEILIAGYIQTNTQEKSIFDIGPIYTLYSSNFLEGRRFRIGGMTTANLMNQIFAYGYVAYGEADRKLKYQAAIAYSFSPRKYHEKENPRDNLSLTYTFDVSTPGQSLAGGNDNILLSQPAGRQITQMQYIRKTELRYEKEWPNHLSIYLWGKAEHNAPAGTLRYVDAATMNEINGFNTAEAGLQLRYAPGERTFNSRAGRDAILNLSRKEAPIIRLAHHAGIKGLLASQHARQYTEGGIEYRLWLSSFGHIDLVLRAGYVWNRIPFPLLFLPNTNQSVFIQPETFAMMRPMEFVADRYAGLHIVYNMKGWLLNRIPVINRLKLREVMILNGICGNLSDKNNPAINPQSLFQLPKGTVPMGAAPYIEAGLGVENIFKIMRIDYYRRLTCLDAPNIQKSGLRIGFHFSF
ncbi:MAG: DUF5686 and carboxypeptidase regulatory-like domain-containing protein [Tannerellaceae bacterium]|jgi:hypothetical protein|nr:DUF5686 and carboxypeptidase regulatory-like domain-containing protein [Tannerellaceae bacterium]